MTVDPLAPLMELPGVAAASDRVRDALSRVHRHRAKPVEYTHLTMQRKVYVDVRFVTRVGKKIKK
ncbi:hypothetical protein R6867_15660, partial [Mycobacterium tuberculosis]